MISAPHRNATRLWAAWNRFCGSGMPKGINCASHRAPLRGASLRHASRRRASRRNATLRLSRRFCAGMAGKPSNRVASQRLATQR